MPTIVTERYFGIERYWQIKKWLLRKYLGWKRGAIRENCVSDLGANLDINPKVYIIYIIRL